METNIPKEQDDFAAEEVMKLFFREQLLTPLESQQKQFLDGLKKAVVGSLEDLPDNAKKILDSTGNNTDLLKTYSKKVEEISVQIDKIANRLSEIDKAIGSNQSAILDTQKEVKNINITLPKIIGLLNKEFETSNTHFNKLENELNSIKAQFREATNKLKDDNETLRNSFLNPSNQNISDSIQQNENRSVTHQKILYALMSIIIILQSISLFLNI